MRFTVACVQTNSGDNILANVDSVSALIHEAAAHGAKLITLPENVFLMADSKGPPQPPQAQDTHPGIIACLRQAHEFKLWILIGSVSIPAPDASLRINRSLLINPQGEIAATYDKIHLFDVDLGGGERYTESSRIAPGSEAVLAQTPWGKLGMTICYDVRFPHLYRMLAQAGAAMLAVPSAFTAVTGIAHWHALLRARAIENGCYVFAPAQCGTHPGKRRTFGHSLIVDPWGKILAEAKDEPSVIYAEVDMEKVAATRRMLPSLKHDRPFTLRTEN